MKALFLAVLIGIGLGANAQERGPLLDRLQTVLGLSAEQTVEVEKILGEQAEQRRALRQEAVDSGDRRAVRGRIQAMTESTEKKLGKVLDEDQMAKYREMMAEMRAGQRGRPGGRGPGQEGRPQQR